MRGTVPGRQNVCSAQCCGKLRQSMLVKQETGKFDWSTVTGKSADYLRAQIQGQNMKPLKIREKLLCTCDAVELSRV
jgi:hypothetical protein